MSLLPRAKVRMHENVRERAMRRMPRRMKIAPECNRERRKEMAATEHDADKITPRRPAYAGAQRLAWLIIALQILISLVTYPFMPERVPSHWDIYGQVDGYLPRLANAVLVPAISIGLYLLIWLLTHYSPRLSQQSQRATAEVTNLIVVGILLFLLIVQLAVDAIALGGPLGVILSFIPALRLWSIVVIVAIVAFIPTIYSFVLYRRLSSEGREPLSPPFDNEES